MRAVALLLPAILPALDRSNDSLDAHNCADYRRQGTGYLLQLRVSVLGSPVLTIPLPRRVASFVRCVAVLCVCPVRQSAGADSDQRPTAAFYHKSRVVPLFPLASGKVLYAVSSRPPPRPPGSLLPWRCPLSDVRRIRAKFLPRYGRLSFLGGGIGRCHRRRGCCRLRSAVP